MLSQELNEKKELNDLELEMVVVVVGVRAWGAGGWGG